MSVPGYRATLADSYPHHIRPDAFAEAVAALCANSSSTLRIALFLLNDGVPTIAPLAEWQAHQADEFVCAEGGLEEWLPTIERVCRTCELHVALNWEVTAALAALTSPPSWLREAPVLWSLHVETENQVAAMAKVVHLEGLMLDELFPLAGQVFEQPAASRLRVLDLALDHNPELHETHAELLSEVLASLLELQELHISNCSCGHDGELEGLLARLYGCNLPSLRILSLRNFFFLPRSLGQLQSLQVLDLSTCEKLISLPESLGELKSLQILDLRGCQKLISLPETLGELHSLKILNLSQCRKLISLPETIEQLQSLQELHLAYAAKLSSLPDGLHRLQSLQVLDLSDCRNLLSLPDGLDQLQDLRVLKLESLTGCTSFPEWIGQLRSLRVLVLDQCSSLVCLPEWLPQLSLLERLSYSDCCLREDGIASLPDCFDQMYNLQELVICYCEALGALPVSLGELKCLKVLEVRCCKSLEALPASIGQLQSLQTLNLSESCSLSSLPESIGDLVSLQLLDLSFCIALSSLPESMGGLQSLKTLSLRGSRLVQLPESFGQLHLLEVLDCWDSVDLEMLPESLGGMTALTRLNLSQCSELRSLPESIGSLHNLQILNLADCQAVTKLPASFGNLCALKDLNLSSYSPATTWELPDGLHSLLNLFYTNSFVEVLPSWIGGFSTLRQLSIIHCESLVTLPDSIGQLVLLERLELRHCSALRSLPETVGQLKSLNKLQCEGCDSLLMLPETVGQLPSLDSITLNYCDSLVRIPPQLFKSATTLPNSLFFGLHVVEMLAHFDPTLQACREVVHRLRHEHLELSHASALAAVHRPLVSLLLCAKRLHWPHLPPELWLIIQAMAASDALDLALTKARNCGIAARYV
eukprot:m.165101 g.165101  ORF g.165101 m.165101 type:complete len:875 (+) comp10322_c0_seq2:32-2656(+)